MKLQNLLLQHLIRKAARAHGFLDPVNVLAQVSRFAQPSDIKVPTELLRLGAVLHARGLVNSQAIQHNLDWVWPYWVERQFDPADKSFIPRAFSLTHINLTHRNWTAVGLPECSLMPIVDPRGLVTPNWDSWSVDCWLVDEDRDFLVPSRQESLEQTLDWQNNLSVVTTSRTAGKNLGLVVSVEKNGAGVSCVIKATATSVKPGWLVVSLRPYNPEGVSFIDEIDQLDNTFGWRVNKTDNVYLDQKPALYLLSDYRHGDVYHNLFEENSQAKINCSVGMATAAAMFELSSQQERTIKVTIPLKKEIPLKNYSLPKVKESPAVVSTPPGDSPVGKNAWDAALAGHCQLVIADNQFKKLYDAALRTLILHTGQETFAGPYTYKRFWFRDAVFIAHALLSANLVDRAREVIDRFSAWQQSSGYFDSQEGEWDSNGEVLWLLKRYSDLTKDVFDPKWKPIIDRAARWIMKKRLPLASSDEMPSPPRLHAGLMPSGFSAEHLGPSDFYYWDNFWSVAGLAAGAKLMESFGDQEMARTCAAESDSLLKSVEQSLQAVSEELGAALMPASPYRRMDSGAVGSLIAGYPLQIWEAHDQRLLNTAEYLLGYCLVAGGFFHDMSHSGINPYLTLHIAQVLLAAGDRRYQGLMDAVASLASSTGQWPEAVHPATKGGCMGDGQHVWAAAEWVMMIRNCFLVEDEKRGVLILCPGVTSRWYENHKAISFGPAPTAFGEVTVSLEPEKDRVRVLAEGKWHGEKPLIEIRLPGFNPQVIAKEQKVDVVLMSAGGQR